LERMGTGSVPVVATSTLGTETNATAVIRPNQLTHPQEHQLECQLE